MKIELEMNEHLANRIVYSTEATDIEGNYTFKLPQVVAMDFIMQLREVVPEKGEPQTAYQRLRAKHPAERTMQDFIDAAKEHPDYPKEGLNRFPLSPFLVILTKKNAETESPKEDDPELSLTLNQMKELFDNLAMEGFAKHEAALIVAEVSRG